ncbi:MAG: DNA polymerase III subunit alpha [Anaerolineae bacterium]
MSAEFVHLHVHSEYSLLDGLPHPAQLAARAKEYNQPAVAITDHGTMFATIEFHDAARKIGVKPLIGIETYLAPRTMKDRDNKLDRSSYHLVLLAENEIGYRNMLRLASAAQLDGFYYYPRVDKEILAKYAEGVIATTGCLAAEIPQLILAGKLDAAREAMGWYRDLFKGRYYVELQNHGLPELQTVNTELLRMAKEFDLKLVATNDVHYLNDGDWVAQDILICIQTGTTVNATERMRMAGHDYYFKSSEEMAAEWSAYPDALRNTLEVAERCTLDLTPKGYHLPYFPVPEGYTPDTFLRALCEKGLRDRYGGEISEAIRGRIDYELSVIHQMGFGTYFLIVWDLTRFARASNIWYNVRGSAAGCLVAYCLGITNLDPFEHKLVFERFLNPGRISMPDIDLDFPDDQREEMIQYTVQKYGKDNVAQIITFGRLLAKAAIRDVGRAMDYPLSDVDRAAKLIPTGPGQTIEGALENIAEFKQLVESDEYIKKLVDNAKLLEGVARHASTHAAGVVVTDRPVVEYVPLHRATRGDTSGFAVTQFPMGDLEHIGLLKIDFLGLATLSIMRRACDLIRARHGVDFNLTNIPVEDDEAFKLLSRGDVTGVFQVEGAGMRRVLTNMRPNKFDHIVATVALFRPGPMEQIPAYIRRLHGEEAIEYKHPILEPILNETYGIIVYQEQIIQVAVQLAGYKPGEADDIRKAVGKKLKDKIEAHRAKFVKGAVANGIDVGVAEAVYGDIEFFARYGFNKAHAADYAVLTCQTAYLKAHYPLEYMTALLSTEIGNMDKIAILVAEARRMGIPVLSPDVRYSEVGFVIDDTQKGIRFGLSAIKNVGAGAVEFIVKARQEGEPFTSLDDFCQRVDLRQVNRRVLESLVKAGAFDGFGHRAQVLQVLDQMMSMSTSAHQASALGQMSFFGTALQAETFGQLPAVAEMENRDKLELEKELMGVYFSEHPLLMLAQQGKQYVSAYAGELTEEMEGHEVTLGGMITNIRAITTKKGDPMAFIQLEDPQGSVEITAFPRVYTESREVIRADALILARGKVQVRDSKITILANLIWQHPLARSGSKSSEGSKGMSPQAAPRPAPAQPNPTSQTHFAASAPSAAPVSSPDVMGVSERSFEDDWLPPPEDFEMEVDIAVMPAPAEEEEANTSAPSLPVEASAPVDAPIAVTPPAPAAQAQPAAQSHDAGWDQLKSATAPTIPTSVPAATAPQIRPEPQAPPPAPPQPPPGALPDMQIQNGIRVPSKSGGNGMASGNGGEGNGKKPAPRPADIPRSSGPRPVAAREPTPTYAARGNGRVVRVLIRRSDDSATDIQRMRDLVRVLRSQEGHDHFSLVVPNAGGNVLLDFPNYNTNYEALASELHEMIADWGELQVQ